MLIYEWWFKNQYDSTTFCELYNFKILPIISRAYSISNIKGTCTENDLCEFFIHFGDLFNEIFEDMNEGKFYSCFAYSIRKKFDNDKDFKEI